MKAYRASHQNERREAVWARQGIKMTVGEYDKQLAAQDGVCAICYKPPSKKKRLDVDHNHKTSKVRGLLCYACNHFLIGRATVAQLRAAVAYMEKYDA